MTKDSLIFIVEDEPVFLSIILNHLKEENYTNLQTFLNGEDCIRNLNQKPELILLDYALEGENGIEVLKAIKSYHKKNEVIFISAVNNTRIILEALKYGAYDYIYKDINSFYELKRIMKRLMRTRNGGRYMHGHTLIAL